MKVEPSGVVMWGNRTIRTKKCTAKDEQGAPITAVWTLPGRQQINVCGACLDEQRRSGDWDVLGTGVPSARSA